MGRWGYCSKENHTKLNAQWKRGFWCTFSLEVRNFHPFNLLFFTLKTLTVLFVQQSVLVVSDPLTHSFMFVGMQVSPLLPCCTQSPCAATETALRNAISSPTRNCHAPRSPEVPMRAWSWPSARNSTASSSTPRTKTQSPPTAPTDEGPSFFVTTSKVTASCFPSPMPRCPGTHHAGTRAKQQGCPIMPWGCWSATQRRSWACCRTHSLTFGPVTAGRVCTAGSSRQEEDSSSTDARATAEMNVSTSWSSPFYLQLSFVSVEVMQQWRVDFLSLFR